MPATHPFDLASLSESLAATVAAAAERVVAVQSRGRWPWSGIVWRSGLVVTAEEMLHEDEEVTVVLPSGESRAAEIVGRDSSTDVGLLKVATGDFPAWQAAVTPAVGSLALVVGRGVESAVAALGIVAEAGGAWRSMQGGSIDARIRLGLALPGQAEGGAVVAPDGSLIGLAVTGPRRRALAIPAATVERAASVLAEKGYVARGFLGIQLQSLGRRAGPLGPVVVAVEPESPAEKAGFLVGDIVTTWNGEPVRTTSDVARRLGADAIGQTAIVGVLRGGAAREMSVAVGERLRA